MFNFPGEKHTGQPIINSDGWKGPGFYACPRDFPGCETYTWKKWLAPDASHEDVEYWGRQVGTLRAFSTEEQFNNYVAGRKNR